MITKMTWQCHHTMITQMIVNHSMITKMTWHKYEIWNAHVNKTRKIQRESIAQTAKYDIIRLHLNL